MTFSIWSDQFLPWLMYDFNHLFQFNWNVFFKHILDEYKLNFKSIDSEINLPQFFCNNSFATCFDFSLTQFFLQKNVFTQKMDSFSWMPLSIEYQTKNEQPLVIKKSFWNSWLKAQTLQKNWDHYNNFSNSERSVRAIVGNRVLF